MQVYIPPKQPFCVNPPASFVIVATMSLKTAGGESTVPPVALQTIAQRIRRETVIDGIRASVQITLQNHGHSHSHSHDHDHEDDHDHGGDACPSSPCHSHYFIQVFFPRALVSYGTAGDVIPIFLPQIGEKCADLAESLTHTFKRQPHHPYSSTVQAMVEAINMILQDGIVSITFGEFVYTSAPPQFRSHDHDHD